MNLLGGSLVGRIAAMEAQLLGPNSQSYGYVLLVARCISEPTWVSRCSAVVCSMIPLLESSGRDTSGVNKQQCAVLVYVLASVAH